MSEEPSAKKQAVCSGTQRFRAAQEPTSPTRQAKPVPGQGMMDAYASGKQQCLSRRHQPAQASQPLRQECSAQAGPAASSFCLSVSRGEFREMYCRVGAAGDEADNVQNGFLALFSTVNGLAT